MTTTTTRRGFADERYLLEHMRAIKASKSSDNESTTPMPHLSSLHSPTMSCGGSSLHSSKASSPCYRWLGPARVTDSLGRRVRAERWVFATLRGAPLARCDTLVRVCATPACVAPDHMRVDRVERNLLAAPRQAARDARRVALERMFARHAEVMHTLVAHARPDGERPRMPRRLVAEARAFSIDVGHALRDEAPRDDVPELVWRSENERAAAMRIGVAEQCHNVMCPCSFDPTMDAATYNARLRLVDNVLVPTLLRPLDTNASVSPEHSNNANVAIAPERPTNVNANADDDSNAGDVSGDGDDDIDRNASEMSSTESLWN